MPDMRKVPMWYYAAGAAGVGVVFFLYRRQKASQAAAAATAATAAVGTVGTGGTAGTQAGTYNANDISALLDQLQGPASTPINDYTPPTGEGVQGLGYQPTSGLSSVVGPGGTTYSQIANAKARNALLAAGQKVYYQPAPGIFMPYNPATMNKTQTPTFAAVPAAA